MYDAVLNPKPIWRLNLNSNKVKRFSYRFDRRVPETLKSRSEKKLVDIIESWCEQKFQESNRITCELSNLNLKDYGYDT